MNKDVDPFQHPRRRLERANNRILRLEEIINDFLKKAQYARCVEMDADGVIEIHSLRIAGRLPSLCEDIAAEALLALRSCLDQAGYASAIAEGKLAPEHTYFPIAHRGSPGSLDNLVKGNCKNLPKEIQALFRGFNAYPGGNDVLCALNEMRNAVHTVFAPTVIFIGGRRIHIPAGSTADWRIIDPPRWDSDKNEIVFLRTPQGTELDYNAQFSLLVAFDEVESVAGVPAVEVLRTIYDEVADILAATQAECRRIGLII
jgi:hypothetical protein